MTQLINYVGSNIISANVYGKWFEYKHPRLRFQEYVKQGKREHLQDFFLFIIVINLNASSSLQTNRYSWCVSPPADLQHVSGSWSLDEDVKIVDRKSGKQQERSVRDGLMGDTKPA